MEITANGYITKTDNKITLKLLDSNKIGVLGLQLHYLVEK